MNSATDASTDAVVATGDMKSQSTSSTKTEAPAAPAKPADPPQPAKDKVGQPDNVDSADGEHDDQDGSENPDDANKADHPKRQKKLSRWMKERIKRAEETAFKRAEEAFKAKLPAAPAVDNGGEEAAERPKTLKDFDYDQAKFDDYRIERKVEERIKAREREAQERQEAQFREQATAKFHEKVDAFEERVGAGAYEEMLEADINTPPVMIDLLRGHERDLEIGLYLARNPAECDRIAELSPLKMARELAKIDEIVSADGYFLGQEPAKDDAAEPNKKPAKEPAPAAPKPRLTNTPPPSKTVHGGAPAKVSPDDPNLSPAERIALWRAERRSKSAR